MLHTHSTEEPFSLQIFLKYASNLTLYDRSYIPNISISGIRYNNKVIEITLIIIYIY